MSLTLIGDSKQTLYLFRNANPDILEKMDRLLPESQEGHILKNYRSPKQLVLLSNYFAESFKGDLEVHGSVPHKDVSLDALEINSFNTVLDECRFVSKEISSLREGGVDLGDVAIIARTNRQLLDFEAGFISEKIPYVIKYDSRSVLNQSSFKVLYSIYSILFNPKDINALCEIITPIKGIGAKFIENLKSRVRYLLRVKEDFSIFEDITPKTMGKTTKQYKALYEVMEKILKPLLKVFKQENTTFLSFNREVYSKLNSYVLFEGEKEGDASIRLTINREMFNRAFSTFRNIYKLACKDFEFEKKNELERFAHIYETIQLSQESYSDSKGGLVKKSAVMLSTIHSFKGLQNSYIFLTSLRRYNDVDPNSFEEKCVFYVAITRAKEKLYLTSSSLIRSFKGDLVRSGTNPFISRYVKGLGRLNKEMGVINNG